MSWSYSGDPSSSETDAVRFLVQDTDKSEELLQNEEISYLLIETGSVKGAAVKAARAIAAKFSRLADFSLGDYSVSYSQRAAQYTALAKELDKDNVTLAIPFAGGITRADKAETKQDESLVRPAFRRNLMSSRGRGGDCS